MRKENLAFIHPGLVSFLAVTFLALPLQSCLQTTSVDCGPNFVCPAGMKCAANQNKCIADDCGDGILQQGEACDDGNVTDTDGCSANCQSTEVCGNSITDSAVGEICDEGDKNAEKGGCDSSCRAYEECGNGTVDPGEACDSNGKDTVICNSNCTAAHCGDGYVNAGSGEECDPLRDLECNINCTASICGDGIVNPKVEEECDSGKGESDGKAADTPACNSNCTTARCGDGYVNTAAGEQCEPGGETPCNINCTHSICGDGIVNALAKEECDSGQLDASGKAKETNFCNSNCTVPRCGDKIVNRAAGEKCDPGSNPRCDISCKFIIGCGNGVLEPLKGEACDDGNSDDCGSCNEDCSQGQDMNRANGFITTKSPVDIDDKNLLSIEDKSKKIIFEFDKNGDGVSSPHIGIDIEGLNESDQISKKIHNAINAVESEFDISSDRESNTLKLHHIFMGSIGNEPRITTNSPGLDVKGMKDGKGVGCAAEVGCKFDWDCKSGDCKSGKCK